MLEHEIWSNLSLVSRTMVIQNGARINYLLFHGLGKGGGREDTNQIRLGKLLAWLVQGQGSVVSKNKRIKMNCFYFFKTQAEKASCH